MNSMMEEAEWAFFLKNSLRNYDSRYPERPGRPHQCRSGEGGACHLVKYPLGRLRSISHLLAPPAHTTRIFSPRSPSQYGCCRFLTALPYNTLRVILDSSLLYPLPSHWKFFQLYLPDLVWPLLTSSASVSLGQVTLSGLPVTLSRAARGAFKMKDSSHYCQLPFLTSSFISLPSSWHLHSFFQVRRLSSLETLLLLFLLSPESWLAYIMTS